MSLNVWLDLDAGSIDLWSSVGLCETSSVKTLPDGGVVTGSVLTETGRGSLALALAPYGQIHKGMVSVTVPALASVKILGGSLVTPEVVAVVQGWICQKLEVGQEFLSV